MPKLSVVLPNYNHAHCIEAQLRAILAQSFSDFELIVMDDASTDDSVAVIGRLIGGDSRARLVQNDTNLSVVANCEKGRALAVGEYLMIIAADDCVTPGSFAAAADALDRFPQAGICLSPPAVIRPADSGNAVRMEQEPWSDEVRYFTPSQVADHMGGSYISAGNMLRAAAYAQAAPPAAVMERLAWHADWFMDKAIAFRHGAAYVPDPCYVSRIHPGSYSGRGMFDTARQAPVVRTILELLDSPQYADVAPLFSEANAMATIPNLLPALSYAP